MSTVGIHTPNVLTCSYLSSTPYMNEDIAKSLSIELGFLRMTLKHLQFNKEKFEDTFIQVCNTLGIACYKQKRKFGIADLVFNHVYKVSLKATKEEDKISYTIGTKYRELGEMSEYKSQEDYELGVKCLIEECIYDDILYCQSDYFKEIDCVLHRLFCVPTSVIIDTLRNGRRIYNPNLKCSKYKIQHNGVMFTFVKGGENQVNFRIKDINRFKVYGAVIQ